MYPVVGGEPNLARGVGARRGVRGSAGGYNGGVRAERTERAGGAFPQIPPAGLLFGLGIDVASAARIQRLLERLPRAYARLFSDQERAYCDDFADPFPRYAARFAAKEAVGKALGIGIIGFVWRDIEVLSGGKPLIALHGDVARIAAHLGVTRVEVSLSHTGGMAYAVAAALKEEVDG
jgi:holo-[acyl-carrier protein] synthase